MEVEVCAVPAYEEEEDEAEGVKEGGKRSP